MLSCSPKGARGDVHGCIHADLLLVKEMIKYMYV